MPKCNATVNSGVASPASEHGALAVGGSPSTEHPRFENTARAYKPAASVNHSGENGAAITDDAVRRLMDLLSKGANTAPEKPGARPSWDQRKALVCGRSYRDTVARRLTQSGYQVFVAEDTRQAVETMRSNKMDVVLLEPQFDPAEQGSAFVIREVNVLRPTQRRRTFFVLISPSLRTMDARRLPQQRQPRGKRRRRRRAAPHHGGRVARVQQLYRDFNAAFNLTAL